MYSDTGNTTSLVLGFPIRTSSDPRSVGSSPRHIAASHVLHRPLMPRHPPCALKHLQHKNQLFENRNYTTTRHHENDPTPKEGTAHHSTLMLATTMHESNTTPHHQAGQQHTNPNPKIRPPPRPHGRRCQLLPVPHRGGEEAAGLLSQSPTVCLAIPQPPTPTPERASTAAEFVFVVCTRPPPTTGETAIQRIAQGHRTPARCGRAWVSWCSLERR
jgi:hypothetical protein